MTKSPRKNVPDVGIELGAACMPIELASDRATASGYFYSVYRYRAIALSSHGFTISFCVKASMYYIPLLFSDTVTAKSKFLEMTLKKTIEQTLKLIPLHKMSITTDFRLSACSTILTIHAQTCDNRKSLKYPVRIKS